MKKITALALSFVICLSMMGCNSQNETLDVQSTASTTVENNQIEVCPLNISSARYLFVQNKLTEEIGIDQLILDIENISEDNIVSKFSINVEAYDEKGNIILNKSGEQTGILTYTTHLLPKERKKFSEYAISGYPDADSYKIWIDEVMDNQKRRWKNSESGSGLVVKINGSAVGNNLESNVYVDDLQEKYIRELKSNGITLESINYITTENFVEGDNIFRHELDYGHFSVWVYTDGQDGVLKKLISIEYTGDDTDELKKIVSAVFSSAYPKRTYDEFYNDACDIIDNNQKIENEQYKISSYYIDFNNEHSFALYPKEEYFNN